MTEHATSFQRPQNVKFSKGQNIVNHLISTAHVENRCDTFTTNIKYYINRYEVENIYWRILVALRRPL